MPEMFGNQLGELELNRLYSLIFNTSIHMCENIKHFLPFPQWCHL